MKLKDLKTKVSASASNLKSKTSTVLQRKEGGSMFGNLLRTAANSASHGILGNGVMMLKPGQTKEESNDYIKQQLQDGLYNAGAGYVAGKEINDGKKLDDSTTKSKVLKYIGIAVGSLFGLVLLIFGLKKVFSSNKSKK